MDLHSYFKTINGEHFDGFLDPPILRWNTRLRSSAGRFIPGSRRFFRESPPIIEIASYLLEEILAEKHVRDTLAHEMIHYWLWVLKKPHGHSSEFWDKMVVMGCSRYNPVPRLRPFRYVYRCPACDGRFPARRKLGVLACAKCCSVHNGGRYDARYRLFLTAD